MRRFKSCYTSWVMPTVIWKTSGSLRSRSQTERRLIGSCISRGNGCGESFPPSNLLTMRFQILPDSKARDCQLNSGVC